MKTYSNAAIAALERGDAIISAAFEILSTPPIRVWGGYGSITIDGNAFDPIGDNGNAIAAGATIGGVAQNLTLQLSGIEPEVLELLDASEVRQAPVVLRSMIFDSSGTQLLESQVHQRGRLDRLLVEETSGGDATISAMIESPGRGLGRRTGRMRTDADQRLIKSTDGGMRNISFAAEKTLYWGGKRPASAGSSLGGRYSGGGGRAEPQTRYNLL